MGRTPASSAKFIVSSESVGVPTAEPWMACSPTMSCNGVTAIGSDDMPTTTNFPVGARPSIKLDIAFESGAVASITCAPPSFCNSSAAWDVAWSGLRRQVVIFLFSAIEENNMSNVPTAPPRVNGILETSLYVESPARSAEFYRRAFGFEPLELGEPLNDETRLCPMRAG